MNHHWQYFFNRYYNYYINSENQGDYMANPKNERKTENIVRKYLRDLGYYEPSNLIQVEEQKSEIETVKQLLKGASKTGKQGIGSPEFIISSATNPNFILIIECKANVNFHESDERNSPVLYAVDGVISYGKFLCKEYGVICVAVSGQTESELKISTFMFSKGDENFKELCNREGKVITEIISWKDYIFNALYDPSVQRARENELFSYARDLHDFMRDYAGISENEKLLLVSGTLIALLIDSFASSFGNYPPEELQKQWLLAIQTKINNSDIPNVKKDYMIQPYVNISMLPELGKPTGKTAIKYPRGVLYELIKDLKEKVAPFINDFEYYDVVGQFYGEFLKYTGGDKKGLGIVLTPRHVTELFALLANVQKDSKVLDICAGTGGFLISAMSQMFKKAVTDTEKENIKRDYLVGVEIRSNMYALGASNMILRGDGKANLYQGSCFDETITEAIKGHNCNIGLLNPPYSQAHEDLHELVFVKHMLDCLDENKNSIGIAIVPMSCAITPSPLKEELLKYHTLEAVMSMPDDLFYPVGTVTCIMVFTAHIPHAISNKKTWFGYWKNDGFIKTKHKGRTDLYNRWNEIRDSWVHAFRNRDEVAGLSVKQQVSANDEWCAEAYMDTDYSILTKDDFEKVVKNYAVFKLIGTIDENNPEIEESSND